MTDSMIKPIDETLSIQVANTIGSKANQPFENAYRSLLHIDNGVYVQGFLVIAGNLFNPQEHAWIETDSAVVDPSLPHLGQPASALHYFPAQALNSSELAAALETAHEDYPEDDPLPVYGDGPYAYYGDVMLGGKSYEQAHQQAQAFNQQLVQKETQN
ncbi:MAG: hypothetical protein WBA10_01725 [Elainellaceae cyanobacterium]